jgi:radical SAM protein with 4Fe4S-binding SPASM domain
MNVKNLLQKVKSSSNMMVIVRVFEKNEVYLKYKKEYEELEGLGAIIENTLYDNSAGLTEDWSEISNSDKQERWPCYHPWLTTSVTVHGEVTVCCVDPDMSLKLGDIQKESIKKMWNSDRLKQMREEHLSNDFKICSICKKCDTWASKKDFFFDFQKNKNI